MEMHLRAGGSLVEVWTTQPENSKPNQQLVITASPGNSRKADKKKTKTDGIETTNDHHRETMINWKQITKSWYIEFFFLLDFSGQEYWWQNDSQDCPRKKKSSQDSAVHTTPYQVAAGVLLLNLVISSIRTSPHF